MVCFICTLFINLDANFLKGLRHDNWGIIPNDVLRGLGQNANMEKKVHKSPQTLQLLPMFRCKYTIDIKVRGTCKFF